MIPEDKNRLKVFGKESRFMATSSNSKEREINNKINGLYNFMEQK
jgi:hypothetical protein